MSFAKGKRDAWARARGARGETLDIFVAAGIMGETPEEMGQYKKRRTKVMKKGFALLASAVIGASLVLFSACGFVSGPVNNDG